MSDVLTKSAFAAKHGVDSSAVSKWIARGHLTPPALLADGRLDVIEAELQLGHRLDLSRSAGKKLSAPSTSAPDSVAPARLSPMEQIKLEQAQIELRRLREQDEARRGRYVLADDIRREHTRELVQFIATVEQRLPELVEALADRSGKDAVVAARRWWRSLRQAEAAAAQGRADSEPELGSDPALSMTAPQQEVAHAA